MDGYGPGSCITYECSFIAARRQACKNIEAQYNLIHIGAQCSTVHDAVGKANRRLMFGTPHAYIVLCSIFHWPILVSTW